MNFREQLMREEGVRAQAYQDHLGFWTIGVGRLIDSRKPGSGLSLDEISYLLGNDIAKKTEEVRRVMPWIDELNDARQAVLIGMAFQMGSQGLFAFTTTLAHVRAGRYAEAKAAMLKSLWARQTPERAKRMADQMETGQWATY